MNHALGYIAFTWAYNQLHFYIIKLFIRHRGTVNKSVGVRYLFPQKVMLLDSRPPGVKNPITSPLEEN